MVDVRRTRPSSPSIGFPILAPAERDLVERRPVAVLLPGTTTATTIVTTTATTAVTTTATAVTGAAPRCEVGMVWSGLTKYHQAMVVNIYEAKTRLSALIAEVERTGEEIVIRRHNVPVAKLVPFRPTIPPRRLGGWGTVVFAEDFEELPADLADGFAGYNP